MYEQKEHDEPHARLSPSTFPHFVQDGVVVSSGFDLPPIPDPSPALKAKIRLGGNHMSSR